MLIDFQGVTPAVAASAYLVNSAEIIGDVTIGEQSSVWFKVVSRGDVNHIRIGARTNVQDGTVIHVTNRTHPTLIGDDVTIGHRVTLHGCTIGNRCLIGIGAIILDGAVIGDDCLVGAGALVTPGTLVPAGSMVLGMPAKIKRDLNLDERAALLVSAHNYTEYINLYRTVE
jgi:gamma-carbonic anhydrase